MRVYSGCALPTLALLMAPYVGVNAQVHCASSANGAKPSDVFFSGTTPLERAKINSRNPAHIVACDVEVAGWLIDPRTIGQESKNGSEDFHWYIHLDPAFIAAKYSLASTLSPEDAARRSALLNAMLPGHVEQVAPADPLLKALAALSPSARTMLLDAADVLDDPEVPLSGRLPFPDYTPSGSTRGITANSFLFPGNGSLVEAELNAWWFKERQPTSPPSRWVRDADDQNLYWPFDPVDPDSTGPLKPGDYVVIRGTLWQDGGHLHGWLCANLSICNGQEQLKCWNSGAIDPDPPSWPAARPMAPHGGWLEIHPVDQIKRIPRPAGPRKTATLESLCGESQPFRDVTYIRDWAFAPDTAQQPNTSLAYEELIDGRFTDMRQVDSLRVTIAADSVHVHLRAHSSCSSVCSGRPARFKATYITWWAPIPPSIIATGTRLPSTKTTGTIVVHARDSRTSQSLPDASVEIYRVKREPWGDAPVGTTITGRVDVPITYPIDTVPPPANVPFTYQKDTATGCHLVVTKPALLLGERPDTASNCRVKVSKPGYYGAVFDPIHLELGVNATPLLPMELTVHVLSTTSSSKTVVVEAIDARSKQQLTDATVDIYGVKAKVGSPLTYPTTPPASCLRALLQGTPERIATPVATAQLVGDAAVNACNGIVSRLGYQPATFSP